MDIIGDQGGVVGDQRGVVGLMQQEHIQILLVQYLHNLNTFSLSLTC